MFLRFGVSDGRANPITHHDNVGIGAKGVIPGREHKQFGIGYYYLRRRGSETAFLTGMCVQA